MSRIQPPDCSKLARNPKNDNEVIIFRRCFVSLIKFSYWSRFHVNIITGSGTMTIFFIRDGLDIPKSKIPPSEFCPISGDWGQLWIPNLPRMCLIIECYWMLQNSRVTAFTIIELLRENQLGGWVKLPPIPTQIRVNSQRPK